MSKIIAICNQKGGVGKTTTSINLSASLAAAEKKTLIIDLDPQGNATTGLGFDKYSFETSVYNVIIGNAEAKDAMIDTELEYLKLIPSNTNLVGAQLELVDALSRETCLKRPISKIRDQFDFIIIDCPPSLGLLTINALTAADSVIVPVQCEYYAMEGLTDLQRTIELVRDSLNPELTIEGIVLTMFDGRNNLSHQVVNEIRTHFGTLVYKSSIPRNVRLSEAPSHGKPILLYDIASKGSESYFELAKEVIEGQIDTFEQKNDNIHQNVEQIVTN
ncbi:AAA family ATPase [bacterium]|nr:AAA family ATPase [bacterium]